jgi:hypothetical protein
MVYQLTYGELLQIIRASTECALLTYRVERGEKPATISKRQAAQQYGWSTINRWIDEGKVLVHKSGDKNHKLNLDVQQLKQVDAAEKASELLCYQNAISNQQSITN